VSVPVSKSSYLNVTTNASLGGDWLRGPHDASGLEAKKNACLFGGISWGKHINAYGSEGTKSGVSFRRVRGCGASSSPLSKLFAHHPSCPAKKTACLFGGISWGKHINAYGSEGTKSGVSFRLMRGCGASSSPLSKLFAHHPSCPALESLSVAEGVLAAVLGEVENIPHEKPSKLLSHATFFRAFQMLYLLHSYP
jgi:hypothetical protein